MHAIVRPLGRQAPSRARAAALENRRPVAFGAARAGQAGVVADSHRLAQHAPRGDRDGRGGTMIDKLAPGAVRALAQAAGRVCVLSGAGMSAEGGIPTFRKTMR